MHKITLETDYQTTGNSSGRQIDTLAIALNGRDYNDVMEDNIDYLWGVEVGAKECWIDDEAEDYFKKTLTKKQARAFADDLSAYDAALDEYKQTVFEDVRAGDYDPNSIHAEALRACSYAMDKDLCEAEDQLRHDWLYGDSRGNFDGILPQANKQYREYGIGFEYSEADDALSITLADDTLQLLKEDGEIDRKTTKAVREWVEDQINSMARSQYAEETRKREARRTENERVREYKKQQAEAAKEAKRAELLELIK